MKKLYLILTLISVTSCAPIQVAYDYEKAVNFEDYKTYNYYSNLETGMSELDNKRLLSALDSAMQSKGYTLAESPDFFIDLKSTEFQQQRNSNVGIGAGGSGRNVGGGISIGLPLGQTQLSREIIFEFVDDNGVGLFWQAISESNYKPNWSPQKREEQFKILVEKVLEGFPPEKD